MAQLKISEQEAPPVVSKKNSKFRYKKKKNQYERQVLGRRETSPRANNFQFRAPTGMGNQQAGTGNQPMGNQYAGMSNQQRHAQVPVTQSGMSNQQRHAQVPVTQSGMSNQSVPDLSNHPAKQNSSDGPRYYSCRVKYSF